MEVYVYKQCRNCKLEKEISLFGKGNDPKDGKKYWCKDCIKIKERDYNKTESGKASNKKKTDKYRADNLEFCKELSRTNTNRIIEENRQFLNNMKNVPCSICGKSFPPECMDFDHINPAEKNFEISAALWKTTSRAKVEEEIKKCRIICCYCHADITHSSRPINKNKYMRAKREKLNELKNAPCAMCGDRYEPWKMQFDHLNGFEKVDCISNLVAKGSWQAALDEIAKCQLLCIGCHRKITKVRANGK
jgi:hypothetical protein